MSDYSRQRVYVTADARLFIDDVEIKVPIIEDGLTVKPHKRPYTNLLTVTFIVGECLLAIPPTQYERAMAKLEKQREEAQRSIEMVEDAIRRLGPPPVE